MQCQFTSDAANVEKEFHPVQHVNVLSRSDGSRRRNEIKTMISTEGIRQMLHSIRQKAWVLTKEDVLAHYMYIDLYAYYHDGKVRTSNNGSSYHSSFKGLHEAIGQRQPDTIKRQETRHST